MKLVKAIVFSSTGLYTYVVFLCIYVKYSAIFVWSVKFMWFGKIMS